VMNRLLMTIIFVTLSCVVCFGQSSYKGLTPGKSTKPDVERILGQPVKNVSQTLVEYKSPEAELRLYVQYRDESPAAIVERMEAVCLINLSVRDECIAARKKFQGHLGEVLSDAIVEPREWYSTAPPFKRVWYWGSPRFIVMTDFHKVDDIVELRAGLYSKDLYESVVPQGGCTGTIFGSWKTDLLGQMNIMREGDNIRGVYSKNNGRFNLKKMPVGFAGEWKDDTGTGTITIETSFDPGTISGKFSYSSKASGTDGSSNNRKAGAASGNRIGAAAGAAIEALHPDFSGKCVP
jgi:hypothetical protein